LGRLAEFERTCPIEFGEGDYDRIYRPHLTDQLALQGDNSQWAAWRGEEPIAFRGIAFKTAPVSGVARRICLSQFSLTHPSARGANLMQCFWRYEQEHPAVQSATFVAHMDEGNALAEGAYGGQEAKRINWRRRVKLMLFPCVPGHGDQGGEASDADVDNIARLLNSAHSGRAFYAEQTGADLHRRFQRAPGAYAANSVLISDHAVLGVWLSGEETEESRGGVVTKRRLATILDYGFDGESGLADLARLIDCWCVRAGKAGCSHLQMFVGEGAPELAALAPRAAAIYSFILRTPIPEPDGNTIAHADALFI
jgi:hypothetical protein